MRTRKVPTTPPHIMAKVMGARYICRASRTWSREIAGRRYGHSFDGYEASLTVDGVRHRIARSIGEYGEHGAWEQVFRFVKRVLADAYGSKIANRKVRQMLSDAPPVGL